MENRVRPLLHAEWDRVLFIHFLVCPEELQRQVPFKLDLFEGRWAIVSFVAFTLRDFRIRTGRAWSSWLTRPMETHSFLNLRAYVHGNDGEPGIYFLKEWLNSKLAVKLGPVTFGLPYRYGKVTYSHRFERGELCGTVKADRGRLLYRAAIGASEYNFCQSGSVDEFLLERYTAFTRYPFGLKAFFRVWHPPWYQVPVNDLEIENHSILDRFFPSGISYLGANFSPGSKDVWMGRPRLPVSPGP